MALGARSYMVKLNGTEYLVDARTYEEGPAQALALKTSEGDAKYGDMSHLSNYVQSDWRGGRAEDRAESGNQFYDSLNMVTWIQGQVSLRTPQYIYGLNGDGRFVPYQSDRVNYLAATTLAAVADTPNFVYTKLSQSFTIDTGYTATECCLLLHTSVNALLPDTATSLTLRIETDNAGSPSGTLVTNATGTATPNLTPIPGWVKFTFAGNVSLSSATTYHFVLSGSGTDTNPQWAYEDVASSGGGGAKRYDGATWTSVGAGARRFYFLAEASDLPSYLVTGAVLNSHSYFAVGTGLYDISGTNLVGVKTDFANVITDLDVLGTTLWIATGEGNNAWTMNTSEVFAEKTGVTGQLLYVFDGYLYRADGHNLYYTADGITWSGASPVGDTTSSVTGMAGYNKTLLIAKPDGLWGMTSGGGLTSTGEYYNFIYQIQRWESQYDANNGVGLCVWNGAAYMPVQYGLVKYDGTTFTNIGPDQGEGLPNGRIGKVVTLIPLLNYLIAVVDATGVSDYGSLLLYNGHGWHEIARSWWAGARMRGAVYDYVTNFVWYSTGNHAGAVQLFDRSDNPLSYQPTYVDNAGYVETSWIGGGMLSPWKSLSEIWVNLALLSESSNFYAGAVEQMRVSVDYQCDRSGLWIHKPDTSIFPVARRAGGRIIDEKTKSAITATTVSSIDAAGVVTVAAIGTIVKGQWVKIGDETRQVKAVSGNTFTPTSPYDYAAAGDVVGGGYPTFREIKFRFRFHGSGSTPILRAFRMAYAIHLTALWRFGFDVLVGDKMALPNGTRDTRLASIIRSGLKSLATETNQLVDLVDIYGSTYKAQLLKLAMRPVAYKEDGLPDVESKAHVELVEI